MDEPLPLNVTHVCEIGSHAQQQEDPLTLICSGPLVIKSTSEYNRSQKIHLAHWFNSFFMAH